MDARTKLLVEYSENIIMLEVKLESAQHPSSLYPPQRHCGGPVETITRHTIKSHYSYHYHISDLTRPVTYQGSKNPPVVVPSTMCLSTITHEPIQQS